MRPGARPRTGYSDHVDENGGWRFWVGLNQRLLSDARRLLYVVGFSCFVAFLIITQLINKSPLIVHRTLSRELDPHTFC